MRKLVLRLEGTRVSWRECDEDKGGKGTNIQLEAVERATPLARTEEGKILRGTNENDARTSACSSRFVFVSLFETKAPSQRREESGWDYVLTH